MNFIFSLFFLILVNSQSLQVLLQEYQIKSCFQRADLNKDNLIEHKQLSWELIKEIDEKMNNLATNNPDFINSLVKAAFSIYDEDMDSKLSWMEFYNMMKTQIETLTQAQQSAIAKLGIH